MKKIKNQEDRMVGVAAMPEEFGEIVVSGKLSVGSEGNPVTIVIIDEETGETLEINNVNRAFLMIEDTRQSSSGWLSLALGELDKLAEVLGFLSKTTLSGLKKIAKR